MISSPSPTRSIVDDSGLQTQEMRTWVKVITNRALIIGTGSPEGAIDALQGSSYMDDSGSTGSILYVKRDSNIGGDGSFGWILV